MPSDRITMDTADEEETTSGPTAACQAALVGTSVAQFLAARPPSTVVSVSDAQVRKKEGRRVGVGAPSERRDAS